MRVQVTNDDGVASPGINALAVAAAAEGHDVFIAAPQRDMSGMSAAIGQLHLDEHIDVQHGHLPEHPDIEVFAVAGPPALTVMAGRLGAYGDPPDLVLSGINAGLNTGRSILHSGTVGAALTASTFGASAMAVSLDAVDPWRCDTACALVRDWLPWLCEAPPGTVLNLNVPSVPLEHLRGVRWASLAQFGAVRAAVRGASRRRLQMELRAGIDDLAPDTDTVLTAQRYATLTCLSGVSEIEPGTAPRGIAPEHIDRRIEPVPRRVAGETVGALAGGDPEQRAIRPATTEEER